MAALTLKERMVAMRTKAEAAIKGDVALGVITCAQGDPVVVGIARPGWACVVTVARNEYDGRKLLQMIEGAPC